jgi:hypothetical protein
MMRRGNEITARSPLKWIANLLSIAALLLMLPAACEAFSVLTHEAIVDQAWDGTLLPAMRARFPHATQQELADARAYARGGAHLPDLGYFPLGSHLFTDLLHYVRTGDFSQNYDGFPRCGFRFRASFANSNRHSQPSERSRTDDSIPRLRRCALVRLEPLRPFALIAIAIGSSSKSARRLTPHRAYQM